MSPTSLTKFDQPLQIELQPSRVLARLSVLIHLLAGGAWLFVSVPVAGKLTVLLLIVLHAHYFHRIQITANSASSVSAVAWDRVRGWRVHNPVNGWQKAVVQMPVYVSARLVAARFHVGGLRCCSTVIVADRLDSDKFRRLRVRLLQSAREH